MGVRKEEGEQKSGRGENEKRWMDESKPKGEAGRKIQTRDRR